MSANKVVMKSTLLLKQRKIMAMASLNISKTSKCTCPILHARACFIQSRFRRSHELHTIAPLGLSYSRHKKCSYKSKKSKTT